MLTTIKDDIDKGLFLNKMREIDKFFDTQAKLPKEARVTKKLILKLEELYLFLFKEIEKYDKISNIE